MKAIKTTDIRTISMWLSGGMLLKGTINYVLEHPETWDRGAFRSSDPSKRRLEGWIQIFSGAIENRATEVADATRALGLTGEEALWLFDPHRRLREICDFAEKYYDAGYDSAEFLKRSTHIKAAKELLHARWDDDDGSYYYYADETDRYYLVSEDELERLGELMEDESMPNAYSEWCAEVGGSDGFSREEAEARGWR